MQKLLTSLFCLLGVHSLAVLARADDLGIRAPDGFEISLFAGDDLAHDIYSMTVDAQGRIVVAGAGYIKTLHDDDGDGRADRATLFSDKLKSGAHGMLADGNSLYASGDNGIWKFTDKDGDGIADGEPQRWVEGLSHKEHGCNGIERGPDGWIYVICGNDAGVNEKFASTPDSPVTKPNCGAILRFSPDGQQSEILAHGFRNPYDLCFHPNGNMFTVDADGERDHHLPWYAPNRLFDVAIGMHHGWVLNGWQWSWNRPAYYFDNVERCAEIGRGSPTGMLCYRHTQFPAPYRGGIFSACWTLGRIYHYPLTPRGSTFDGKVDIFLETTGTTGFAPVDMTVGPDGSMFVAIGGRRTRGSVFNVSYVGPVSEERREPANDLESVLAAPQPLAAWSRAKWLPLARKLKSAELEAAALNEDYPTEWRVRAIEVVTEVHGALSSATAGKLIQDKTPEVAARAAWNIGRLGKPRVVAELLGEASKAEEPLIQRAAWEGLASVKPMKGVEFNWSWDALGDRRCRTARALSAAKGWLERDVHAAKRRSFSWDDLVRHEHLERTWCDHFTWQVRPADVPNLIDTLMAGQLPIERKDEVLRLIVLALGDISVDPSSKDKLAGYAFADNIDRRTANSLASAFADFRKVTGLDPRERARLLAMLGDPAAIHAIEPISSLLTPDSSPVDDIHYLMCLSRMPGERTEAARKNIAAGIARLDGKMKVRSWYPSRNWPDRVGETFAALAKHDTRLPAAVIEHEAFQSATQAFLFTRLDAEHQATAARKLLRAIDGSDDDVAWTPELVTLVAALPAAESLPALRQGWDDFAVRDAILLQLAKTPAVADRERFAESLSSIDPIVIEKAAGALKTLKLKPSDDDWLALMQSLRQTCSAPPAKAARQSLSGLAVQWSGKQFEIKERGKGEQLLADYQPWFSWFAKAHPTLASKLTSTSGDAASWRERLAQVNWSAGDAIRGKAAYEKRSCVKCHAGNSPLGPDLTGAASRFSREDLVAAIVDPSKDVSPLYQATQIVTGSGRIYHGLVVYESPDGTLLTTGSDTTIRIAGDEIVSMAKSRLSLMPTGLLDQADDRELADLVAYLQTLRGKR